jgi:hypothetical protein
VAGINSYTPASPGDGSDFWQWGVTQKIPSRTIYEDPKQPQAELLSPILSFLWFFLCILLFVYSLAV